VDIETGETEEHKLAHAPGEAEKFYRRFAAPACGHPPVEKTGAAPPWKTLRVSHFPTATATAAHPSLQKLRG
jgi:hypothetical protein